ncbi:DUF547 domain-containing protein [Hyunsoonleella flava]|uniref:DUF547 domain-containing protein n=2 Tax=Hyunsoonleella flava TaxID=2527939 RepID=A0A4Q9FL80_9FLAO|nr:DUF547 domain-containing protein [Hyunsoonleella flava]
MTDSLYVPDSDADIEIVNKPLIKSSGESTRDSIANKAVEEKIEEPILEHDTILYYPEAFNHDSWDDVLEKYVSTDGNVDYSGLKKSRGVLLKYIELLANNTPNNDWTKEDKLAYWINAYNALTIDLILRNYPIKSIKDIKDPWKQRHWKLGKKWYNLDEIEHQILRKMDEPRIHFAIVCASDSCPKLQNDAFTASNLEQQLTKATEEFLSDKSKNDLSDNPIKLSKIFKWFSKDFNQNTNLIDFLNKYSEETVYHSTKIRYMDYNWDLNE